MGDFEDGPSGAGKWNAIYRELHAGSEPDSVVYGDDVGLTYWMAAAFLADMSSVEDWGCGRGGFKKFFKGNYTGIDGSHTPFANRIVDLCTYRSQSESILLRHVLEHNYRWSEILQGALASFEKKMCLVLFTPFTDDTRVIKQNLESYGVDVPDISFARRDLEAFMVGLNWKLFPDIRTGTGYGVEHVYFFWR